MPDDGPAASPGASARLVSDPKRPVVLQGIDGQRLPARRVPDAWRRPAWRLPPGDHLLWAVGEPYGLPLLPQRLRCYALRVHLDAGHVYTLAEDLDAQRLVVRRDDLADPVATAGVVDTPWVMERRCRYPDDPR